MPVCRSPGAGAPFCVFFARCCHFSHENNLDNTVISYLLWRNFHIGQRNAMLRPLYVYTLRFLGDLPVHTRLLSAEHQQPAGGVASGKKPRRGSCSALSLLSGLGNKSRVQLSHESAPLRTSFSYKGHPTARLATLHPLPHHIPCMILPYAFRKLAGANTLAECGTSAARWRCCFRQETFSGQL